MTGSRTYTAHTILSNNNQCLGNFVADLNSFQTRTDVNNSKVEVDHKLVTMNNPIHVSSLNFMLVLCHHMYMYTQSITLKVKLVKSRPCSCSY